MWKGSYPFFIGVYNQLYNKTRPARTKNVPAKPTPLRMVGRAREITSWPSPEPEVTSPLAIPSFLYKARKIRKCGNGDGPAREK